MIYYSLKIETNKELSIEQDIYYFREFDYNLICMTLDKIAPKGYTKPLKVFNFTRIKFKDKLKSFNGIQLHVGDVISIELERNYSPELNEFVN